VLLEWQQGVVLYTFSLSFLAHPLCHYAHTLFVITHTLSSLFFTLCLRHSLLSVFVIPSNFSCHSRESGNPGLKESWSPIKLGMTVGMILRMTLPPSPWGALFKRQRVPSFFWTYIWTKKQTRMSVLQFYRKKEWIP